MQLREIKFRPDTCGCVIDFSYDADLTGDAQAQSYALVSIEKAECHAALSDEDAYNSAWHQDNKNKNKVESALLDSLSDHVDASEDAMGTPVKKWKKGIKYVWSFDGERNLSVSISGGAPVDSSLLQSIVTNTIGES